MKKIYTLCILLLTTAGAYAQLERAAFTEVGRGAVNAFATDYHALGINPANLAYANPYNKKFTIGFGQVAASNYGEGFTRSEFMEVFRNTDRTLTFDEQFDAANRFADAAVALDVTVLGFGFALNTEKAGNFAFSVSARATHFSRFNQNASSHMWRGFVDPYFDQWVVPAQGGGTQMVPNGGSNSPLIDEVILGIASNPQAVSTLYDGTVMRSMAYFEYSLGYGKQIYGNDDFKLHGGLGLKYLQGYFALDVAIEDRQVARAYMSHSPVLEFDFGAEAAANPSFVPGNAFKPVGSGFGFDLGLAMEVGEKLRVSASITDIGSITYDGNVYSARDTLIYDIETLGIESFNITEQFDVFAGDQGVFEWSGRNEQRFVLPTMLRFGMAYQYNEKFQFGLDAAVPFNDAPGSIEKVGFAAGVDFAPTPGVRFSSGFAAGDNYGFRVPFGINFMVDDGSWEFGLATRDVLFYLRDDRPNISVAMGFLRFRFGTLSKLPPPRFYE